MRSERSSLWTARRAFHTCPWDVQDIDCDFLAFSGHKMMGPTGIGALYAKRELLEEMEPFLTGGEMVLQVTYEKASWAGLPWKFEAGTPNIADSIGMGAAVDYLAGLGMENVREHEKQITAYALERFKEIEEVTCSARRTRSYAGESSRSTTRTCIRTISERSSTSRG